MSPGICGSTLEGVSAAARALRLPVLFLAHPRTLKRLDEFGLCEVGRRSADDDGCRCRR